MTQKTINISDINKLIQRDIEEKFKKRLKRDKDLQAAIQVEHHFYQRVLSDPQLLLLYINIFKFHSIRAAITDVIRRKRDCERLLKEVAANDKGQ